MFCCEDDDSFLRFLFFFSEAIFFVKKLRVIIYKNFLWMGFVSFCRFSGSFQFLSCSCVVALGPGGGLGISSFKLGLVFGSSPFLECDTVPVDLYP